MTVQKAIKIIDTAIEDKQKKKNDFLDPNMPWNKGDDNVFEFARGLAQVMDNDIEWFQAIKNQLRSKKETKCKHPKKLLDIDPDGKPYCMRCNQDL